MQNQINKQRKNKLIDVENRLVITRGRGLGMEEMGEGVKR